MIVGIGTDLAAGERMATALARFGTRFARRICTEAEWSLCQRRPAGTAACLARRFAAKEALAKALGTGMGQGVWFTQIEVLHHSGGAPAIHLTGAAWHRWQALGAPAIHLSLSDDHGLALAFVVLSRD